MRGAYYTPAFSNNTDVGTASMTVKKGAPKKVHTIKIKVVAAGNANWKASSKTITCKVNVK